MKSVTKMFLMLLVIAVAFGTVRPAMSQTTLLTESFDAGSGTTPPPSWAIAQVTGSTLGLSFVTTGSTGYPSVTVTPYNGTMEVFYNSYSVGSGNTTRLYRTVGTSTVGYAGAGIDFAMYHDLGYATYTNEGITPQYSTDGGGTWTSAGSLIPRYDGTSGWTVHTIALPAGAAGQANLRIGFLFTSQFGNNCFMDFAHLYGYNTGTLTGTVTNALDGSFVVGASVVVNGAAAVLTNASGVYTKPNVNGGTATITATLANFQNYSGTATVVAGTTTVKNFTMTPVPVYLQGYITNAGTNAPVAGAKITVGATYGYSLPDGSYYFQAYPVGAQTVTVTKPGFITSTAPVTILVPGPTNYNVALQVNANPPGPVTAALNAGSTAVDINWSVPTGLYEIIYDDGGRENWTVWSVGGNMNAMKFTPITGNVTVMAGRVNIGDAANYAAGTDPTLLAPFQMAVYDASGTGGTPGVQVGSLIDVIPTNFGWNTFTFPTPVNVTGVFYLVMIQGGNPPNAAGLGVDETTNKLRSYSRFVTGGGPWLPASGNYMIRAVVTGQGGPLNTDAMAPRTVITANAIDGLIYEHTPSMVMGVEGEATYNSVDWSSLTQVANMQRPSNTTTTIGNVEATDVDASGVTMTPAVYTTGNTDAPMATLFDNGPAFNSTGTGAGGANESIYYQGGTGTYGSSCAQPSGVYVADDFVVPSGKTWGITSMDFYSYQTNSGNTSTINGIYLRIWNGKPGVAGSTVVWGNMTTNRLYSTSFANIYRVTAVNGGVARPIMKVTASTPGMTLTAGTYWAEWGCTGTVASGPWVPPVVTANNVTGNATQTVDAGVTYVDVLYNTYAQGFPYTITGAEIVPGGSIPYTVWRLLEGQESNEALWGAPIASNITATSVTDASWPSLPDGPYRWAVKAGYPVNRLSTPVFSNVIGKNWTVAVTVNVSLTCGVTPVAGTIVKLQNTSFSQYVYTATTTATGTVSFPAVWKGTYDLTVSKVGYDTYTALGNLIMGPMTFDVTLLQQKLAPSNMFVDNKSLFSTWNAPQGIAFLMNEDWASGSFATNQWTAEAVWTVYTGLGNPAPDAEFSWYPTLTNYSRSLTSKTFTGTGSPDFKLVYDIYLSDYLSDGNEQLDVEMQIGAGAWTSIKQYVNNGSMPWTTETLNIASVGSQSFKIRFRAHGVNSYNINNWDIDNIKIRSIAPDPKPCILAYNVYLNGVLDGVTLDTTYQIPPSHVTYNTVYQACVKAVYGSGYSAGSCYTFTSKFLYPPTNLQVEAVECAAYLTWEKPTAGKKVNVPAFKGTVEHTAASIGRAPVTPSNGDNGMPGNGVKGSTAFGIDATTFNTIDFDVDNVGGMTVIAGLPNTSDFWMDIEYPVSQPDWAYAVKNASDHLYKVDHATGAFTDLGSLGNGTTDQLLDLAIDPTSGSLFGVTSNSATLTNDKLWSINPATPVATLIGVTGSSGVIGLACDKAGGMYGQDIVADNLWSFDKVTGVATIVGPLGFNANYGQGMFYDEATDAITMCAFNAGTFLCEIRVVDIATGASTVLSSTGDQIAGATVPITSGGGAVKGLLGYKIYRDGTMVHQVGDPDTLFWYDFTVEPGNHTYGITALYDLSEYITPPPPPLTMFDESMVEGPVNIDIECGRELPFYEPWDQGSFSFNEWTLSTPTNTNWTVSAGSGNPAPAADFSWDPIQYNYSLSIQTPVLNGGPFTCAMIWCDFDYKLADRNSTGKEKLYVDAFSKGVWKKITEFANTASKDWTPMHVDITTVKGKAFKVRFRAEGENSADILHWYVDNIHIYAKCNPPVEVSVADVADKTVTLTWNAPECGTAGPNPIWIHWDDGTNSDAIGTGGAVEFDIAARWDASQIVALDGGQVTKIAFYPAGSGVATYKLRVWEGPDAATLLVDQAVPSVTLDDWNIVDVTSPVPINVSKELWIGVNVNASSGYPAGCDAGPAVDGYGDMMYYQGAWATLVSLAGLDYNWNVQGYVESTDDHVTDRVAIPIAQNQSYKSGGTFSTSGLPSLNTKKFNPSNEPVADGRALLGYNIYRSDDMRVTYNKLNANLWPDTSYVNTVPDYQDYYYYVTAVFPTYGSATCESDSSNVVKAGIVTGIDPMNGGKISIYPNPATDNVQVKSDFTITNIDVLNYIGQTVYTRQNVSDKNVKVNVANLTPGVYFVKVTTVEGIKTVKITVTR